MAIASDVVAAGRVDIQVGLGFAETFRLDRWTPVTVTLSNRGNDLIGQLEVDITGGDELQENLFTLSHRRDIELPRDSRKRFHFTVFPDNPSRPLMVRVSAAGREVARREIDLRGRSTGDRLVLVLSRDADLDYLNANSDKASALRVLYPHPELLPDRWQGYDGVAAIVIHGMSLERLSARQFEALNKWLAHGGIIAISAGPDDALLRTPRLAELVPGTPVGVAQLADAVIVSESGVRLLPEAPPSFAINRLTRLRGRVRYHANEIPLVIEADRGRGRVLYLAFDVARPPFASWPGMRPLWLNSLRLPPLSPLSLDPVAAETASAVSAAIKRGPQEFPAQTTVFVFLALYLGILATGYRLASAAKSSRWILACLTWASPLLFAPVAYLLFGPLLFPKGASAVTLATIEPFPRSPYGYLQLDLGLYTNRRSSSSSLQFDYEGAEPVFRPARKAKPPSISTSFLRQTGNWVLHEGERRSLQPSDKHEYVLHLLEGQDIIAFALSGTVTATNAGPRLQLRNDSGRPLRNTWLVFEDKLYWLGAIAAGANVERAFDTDIDALDLEKISWRQILAAPTGSSVPERYAAERLLEQTRRVLGEQQASGSEGALLVGFSASPLRLMGATRWWQRTELTLVLLRLAVTADHAAP